MMAPLVYIELHNQKVWNCNRLSDFDNDCDSTMSSSSYHSRGADVLNSPQQTLQKYIKSKTKKTLLPTSDAHGNWQPAKQLKKFSTYGGLERTSSCNSDSVQIDKTIHTCIDAVMNEQERQWSETDSIDWDLFHEVSLEVSNHSASLAYSMAMYNEKEAYKAYLKMAKEQVKDDISVSTNITEISKSTMVHEIKSKHNQVAGANLANRPSCKSPKNSKTCSKKGNSGPPKSQKLGSRNLLGDAFNLMKRKGLPHKSCGCRFAIPGFINLVTPQ